MYIVLGHTLIGKIGWSLIVLIAAIITIYLINKTYNFILANPFTIDVDLFGGDLTTIQFPTIAICADQVIYFQAHKNMKAVINIC